MSVMDIAFANHPSIKGREDRYMTVSVNVAKALKSWKSSLFSFEWLDGTGAIRPLDDLPLHERDKRLRVESTLKSGGAVERPVLGIGILDNIEIGAGRDVFLTLAAQGLSSIEVHIPASNAKEFKGFIS
jgi:hypothetical protein